MTFGALSFYSLKVIGVGLVDKGNLVPWYLLDAGSDVVSDVLDRFLCCETGPRTAAN